MATKKPWAWLDTETTGLKPSEGARVLQVAVHVTDDALRDVTRGGRVRYSSYIRHPAEVFTNAAPIALVKNHFAKGVHRRDLAAMPNEEAERPLFACGPYAFQPVTDELLARPDSRMRITGNRDLAEFAAGDHVFVVADPVTYFAAPTPTAVWSIVHTMLSGCHLVCQNLPFDKPFVENELALCGLTFPCDFRGIEIMSHSNLLAQKYGRTAWGLDGLYEALAKERGLGALDAHRADSDVARMMEVYRYTRERFLASWDLEAKCRQYEGDEERLVNALGAANARVAELEAKLKQQEESTQKYLFNQTLPEGE